jgi:hypothetical protein
MIVASEAAAIMSLPWEPLRCRSPSSRRAGRPSVDDHSGLAQPDRCAPSNPTATHDITVHGKPLIRYRFSRNAIRLPHWM